MNARQSIFTAFAAVMACLAFAAPAGAARPGDSLFVPASGRLAGMTGSDLLGLEAQQLYSLPASANPYAGAPNDCLRAGKVLIVWTQPASVSNPTVCRVKPGTPVFFFTYGAFCSTVDSPPYYAVGYEAQRECAQSELQQCGCHPQLVSVDDGPAVETTTARYLAVTKQVTAVIPPDNIFGVPPQTATLVGAAYVGMLRPLPPGKHVISIQIPNNPNQLATIDVIPNAA